MKASTCVDRQGMLDVTQMHRVGTGSTVLYSTVIIPYVQYVTEPGESLHVLTGFYKLVYNVDVFRSLFISIALKQDFIYIFYNYYI